MGQSFVPGDIELSEMTLEGEDFFQNFVGFSFQEHLFAPYVKGSVRVAQQQGAQEIFTGEKDSSIVFNTPNGEKRKYSLMRTNNIGNIKTDENQRTRWFDVEILSKHALINNATPNYQKSIKNKQISSVIESIAKEGLGLEIPFNIDKTKGLQGSDNQPLILTQRSPLKHLDELRRLAVSNDDYDGFLLFSGIGDSGGEELNFKSIHELLKKDPVVTLTNLTNFEIGSSMGGMTMENAIEVWMPQQTDAMAKGASFSQGTTKFDINTTKVSYPKYKYGADRQQYGSKTSTNPGKTSGFVNEPHNGLPGTYNVIVEDSRSPDTYRPETAAYTEALFQDMAQNFLTVKIPGNSNLKVGQIVDFDMREDTENNLNKDTKFSGKNLIIGMTHYVGPVSDRPRYVTYLDLVNVQTTNGKIS
jgi:hypothetical protein